MITVSDLAKELNITENELRKFIAELNLNMSGKNNKISIKKAEEIRKKAAKKFKKEIQKVEKAESEIKIPPIILVKELAEILKISVSDIIKELMKNGVMATINEEIDFETAAIVACDLGFDNVQEAETDEQTEREEELKVDLKSVLAKEDKKKLKERPPVVVIMGHVDHGKTLLLDTIRTANVISKEAGGITQHIGTYQVEIMSTQKGKKSTKSKVKKSRRITFLDTPGHEAFTEMRARGVNIADIIVLVIAANDGVKPQTLEVLDYIKKNKIPHIIALNKIDKPEADPERVKQQLAELEFVVEEWGGDVLCVPISAKTGKGVDDLLEMILLLADIKEFKANPHRSALGTVIESKIDYGKGSVATVLIQSGTLKQSDNVVVGGIVGKIRVLEDYKGKKVKQAFPSTPVKIAGLSSVPHVGDILQVVKDEKEAKLIASSISKQEHIKSIKKLKKFDTGDVKKIISSGDTKELKLILKVDVKGSLEALTSSLSGLSTDEVTINIISKGVGGISESDVMMAKISSALLIGFNVNVDPIARKKARSENIKISIYNIIYELIDDIKEAISDLLGPEIIEIKLGKIKVLEVFMTGKKEVIVGGKVTSGKVEKGVKVRILRGDKKVGEGVINSLQKERKNVDEVGKGHECGLKIEGDSIVEKGDTLEIYIVEERKRKL